MNPIKSILVHLDAGQRGGARLHVARTWGGRLGASVTALYVVTPASLGMAMVFAAGVPSPELLAHDEARLAAARRLVDDACTEPGVQIEWREADDAPERTFVQQALYADLLVLGQHDGTRHDSGVAAGFVHAVIIESGKPALVIPSGVDQPEATFGNVFVAWKESREAARALTGALPLLQKADSVCVAVEAGAGDAHRPRLQQFLQRHGLDDVQFRSVSSPAPQAGDALLSMAADIGASLMVMGCYGHSRGREWILGGATRGVLQSMTLPVLMAH